MEMTNTEKMTRPTAEQTLERKANKAKDNVKLKYFKQFCKCMTDTERNEIGAKMNVLDSVVYDLIKDIKAIDN